MNQEEYRRLLYLLDLLDDDEHILSFSLKKVMSEINRAPSTVKQLLKERCPTVKHLEEYLTNNKEYFWVENEKVSLAYPSIIKGSEEAVRYFEDILDTYEIRPNYENFYGHIGQADPDTKTFMGLFYSGNFKQFFLNHPDVFVIFNDDTVALIENEAVKYFQQCLREDREGWPYMNLCGCIGQAPRHIISFINDYYPEEDFLQFLTNNSYVFDIDEENCVYLN